jgi:RNA polymerase sigma-54 factor
MTGVQLAQYIDLTALPQLTVRPSPALIAATALLALPSPELERAVEHELARNPALERAEWTACNLCGRPLLAARCFSCERPRRISQPAAGAWGPAAALATAELTPAETLFQEVAPLLEPGGRAIADYLLGSLDRRGFLDTTAEEAAIALGVETPVVAYVLHLIQQTGPAGIAARDIRECLLLQLDRCPDGGPVHELARRIVAEHLPLLGKGTDAELARRLGVGRAEVLAAREFVRARLQPYPGLALDSAPPAPPLVPDIRVRDTADGFEVELVERDRFWLIVSPAYERAAAAPLPDEERKAIRRQMVAAREFIDRLEQRWRTIGRVAEIAISRQHGFLRHGGHLLPLTRAQVAGELGVHESTVSRAVAGRNVLLPSGRIVPFARFFGRSSAPHDALASLLAAEERPKSDAELARDMASLGFVLARRTVAKYREQLGVLPSSQRRPAEPISQRRPAKLVSHGGLP